MPNLTVTRPDSPIRQARFTLKGPDGQRHRFRRSTGTDREDLAEALAATWYKDLYERVHFQKITKPRMSLDEAFGRYWLEHVCQSGKVPVLGSARDIERMSETWLDVLEKQMKKPGIRLDELDGASLADWRVRRLAMESPGKTLPPLKKGGKRQPVFPGPRTINADLTHLRAVWMMARNIWKVDVGAGPDGADAVDFSAYFMAVSDGRDRIMTAAEESAILDAAASDKLSRHLVPIIQTELMTALRKADLLRLTWGQIDFDAMVIRVRGKSKKPGGEIHTVPLIPDLVPILGRLRLPDSQSDDRVFTRVDTKGKAVPVNDIKRSWATACKRAAAVDLTFRDLRRTAATRLLNAGAPVTIPQKLLGHSDLKTTRLYLHTTDEDVARWMTHSFGQNAGPRDTNTPQSQNTPRATPAGTA